MTEGVEAAVTRASEAAGDRYATIGGRLHVVPVLLGSGIPLFDGAGAALRLSKLRVVDAPNVTHLRYRVER